MAATRARTISTQPTDWGNSLRIVSMMGGKWRYCPALSTWLYWDSAKWCMDRSGYAVHSAASELSSWIRSEALELPDSDKARKELFVWATKSEARDRINAALALAATNPEMQVGAEELDQGQLFLNTHSGGVHLRLIKDPRRLIEANIQPWEIPIDETLFAEIHAPTIFPHTDVTNVIREYPTRIIPCRVDMDEPPPLWTEFIEAVTCGDTDLARFLQRAVGYSLSGDTSEKCLFVLYGPPDTGKSTFLETIMGMMGEYASKISMQTLLSRRGQQAGTASYDLARLAGVRFVTASEANDGTTLDVGLVKDLTGNETITARQPYGRFFNFRPQFKLWLSTNNRPQVNDSSGAIWRRIKMIPFMHQFDTSGTRRAMDRELRAELPGILGWAIRGFTDWSMNGLMEPNAVTGATNEYREDVDVLGRFLAERTYQTPVGKVRCSDLYVAYREWARAGGEEELTSTMFGIQLRQRGIHKTRTSVSRYYEGIDIAR